MTKFSPEALKGGYSVRFPYGGDRSVFIQPSANAWWTDQNTLYQFLNAISFGSSIREACSYVGITLKQYKYFHQLHPEFKEIREAYASIPILKARQTVARAIETDARVAMRYLERKVPEEFGRIRARKSLKDYGTALTPEQENKLEKLAELR